MLMLTRLALAMIIGITCSFTSSEVEETEQNNESNIMPLLSTPLSSTPFTPFTGKVTRNKVRLRLQPNLDGCILQEFDQGDFVAVAGETDDFYAITPSSNTHAYIFRSFVLDGVVEGTRVNVRLEPDLDAPIIAQLSTGDCVKGEICEESDKWLEIDAPDSVQFFVAKEYIENAGPASYLADRERRVEEVDHLLSAAYLVGQTELRKPFEEISLDRITENFVRIVEDFSDLSDKVESAQEGATLVQDLYLEKKVAFLEAKAKNASEEWETQNAKLNDIVQSYQEKIADLEEKEEVEKETADIATLEKEEENDIWSPTEQLFYQNWTQENRDKGEQDFYQEEKLNATKLTGILQPYDRPVKNKPGDFVLLDSKNQVPIAYLYSTQVNLQEKLGNKVTVTGTLRPNNHFAFPAYHVLSFE